MVSCSGSWDGVNVDRGAGGADGLGTASARGVGVGRTATGVSDGFGEGNFLFGDFSGVGLCLFFLDFGLGVSLSSTFFFFFAGFVVF